MVELVENSVVFCGFNRSETGKTLWLEVSDDWLRERVRFSQAKT